MKKVSQSRTNFFLNAFLLFFLSLLQLKEWIDNNQEYLLILVSDHGVDQYGIEGYRMHGLSSGGNEPFILFYNPRLESKQEIRIDVVDVAPTIALFLRGVDIPSNSIGLTRTFFGLKRKKKEEEISFSDKGLCCTGENQTELDIKALKQNIVQLKGALEAKGGSVDEAEWSRFLNNKETSKQFFEELLLFSEAMKSALFDAAYAPWFRVFLFTCFICGTALHLLITYNEGLEEFVVAGNLYRFSFELLAVLAIYSTYLLQMMFCWWGW